MSGQFLLTGLCFSRFTHPFIRFDRMVHSRALNEGNSEDSGIPCDDIFLGKSISLLFIPSRLTWTWGKAPIGNGDCLVWSTLGILMSGDGQTVSLSLKVEIRKIKE